MAPTLLRRPEYIVTVIATDPKGIPTEDAVAAAANTDGVSDTVTVVISVTAVDEPPIFTAGATSVMFDEVTGIDDKLALDQDGELAIALSEAYVANDPEDGSRCYHGYPWDTGAPTVASSISFAAAGVLNFKDAPNFEKPADADKDNVYEVTITATDGNANMATRDVKVTVTNAEEDGEVTLSQTRPRVGLAITAGYSDLDGGLASATWQWWRTDSNTPI